MHKMSSEIKKSEKNFPRKCFFSRIQFSIRLSAARYFSGKFFFKNSENHIPFL